MKGFWRGLGLSVFILVVAAGAAGAQPAVTSQAASTVTSVIPVDGQEYRSDLPNGTDAYAQSNGQTPPALVPDTAEVHVAYSGGQMTYHGFFHLELDAVPPGATITGGKVSFTTNKEDSANPQVDVNSGTAQVKACLLKTPLTANFDPSKPPPYDSSVCTSGKETSKVVPAPNNGTTTIYTFTFDLASLLGHWATSNTGAALVPAEAANSPDNWSIGFDKSQSTAAVDYLEPASTTTYSTQAQPPVSTIVSQPGVAPPASLPTVEPVASPTEAASPSQAPSPSARAAGAPTGGRSSGGGGGVPGYPLWLLLLTASLGVSAALVGQPIVQALSAGGGLGGMLVPLRSHPRMFYIAGGMAAWSIAYTGYSAANGQLWPKAASTQQVAVAPSTAPYATAAPTALPSNVPATPQPGSLAAALPEHPVGKVEQVGNTTVVVPTTGGPPVANLFSPSEDNIGIDSKYINICAHAALIFGQELHLSAQDLAVFWQNLNEHGPYWIKNAGFTGIYGKKVADTYFDDQYKPGPAVQAAQNCADQGPPKGQDGVQSDTPSTFFLEGGIGFDQIPAVRVWAEQHHVLYYHHMATSQGDQGLRYSFSYLPTVEDLGVFLGQYVEDHLHGHKFGIIYRNSTNWEGGSNAFAQYLQDHGDKILASDPVNNNQGNYQKEISDMQTAGVDVLMSWENALATPTMIKQAQSQGYTPHWLTAGFNIVPMTVGANGNPPTMTGFGAWPAYACHDYSGGFAAYADDIKEFEREYATYDNGTYQNLCGNNAQGADLLFGNWVVDKQIAQWLIDCGPDCTRNKAAGMLLTGYKANVPPNCPEDWSRRQRQGSYGMNIEDMFDNPNDTKNWDYMPSVLCAEHIP